MAAWPASERETRATSNQGHFNVAEVELLDVVVGLQLPGGLTSRIGMSSPCSAQPASGWRSQCSAVGLLEAYRFSVARPSARSGG